MSFNFGATSSPFGTTAQSTASPFGFTQPASSTSFGIVTQAPSSTSFTTLFAAPTTSLSSSGYGTSTQANVAPLISSQPQTNLFSGLSAKPAQTNLFGTTTSTAGFSLPAPQQNSSIFSSFQKPAQTSLFGTQPNFVTQQQQQLQLQQIDQNQAFYQSIFQVNKFGDERDTVLANFNYVQACLGTGKGYYSQTLPPVTYTTANPFYRCKAVGYEFIYTNNNEDGQVSFDMKKSHEKIRSEETQFITALQQMLGRPSIFFKISGIKATSEEQCLVNIYAEDQTTLRRVTATDLANVFLQPNFKPQMDTWGVTSISAKVRPSPEQLRRYLETAPEGIDPRVWRQAQADNPDPVNMIPTPIIGIDALKKRIAIQQAESDHHTARLTIIDEACAQYQQRHSTISAEIVQMKRKQAQLAHRLLTVIVRQEVMRKTGTAISADEEELEKRVEYLEDQMNSPTEFKGRLRELLSQIRLHQYTGPTVKYTIDEASLHQIKEFLETTQSGIKHLVRTVKGDIETLHAISDNMTDTTILETKDS